jgi:hypothetical protein
MTQRPTLNDIKVAQAQDILGPNYIISTRDEMLAIYDSQQGMIDALTEGMIAVQNARTELDTVFGIVSAFVPNALDMPIERAMVLALGTAQLRGAKLVLAQSQVENDASFEAGREYGFEDGQKAANDTAYVSGYANGERAVRRHVGYAGLVLLALSLAACLPW